MLSAIIHQFMISELILNLRYMANFGKHLGTRETQVIKHLQAVTPIKAYKLAVNVVVKCHPATDLFSVWEWRNTSKKRNHPLTGNFERRTRCSAPGHVDRYAVRFIFHIR